MHKYLFECISMDNLEILVVQDVQLCILNEQHSKTKILKCCLYENMTLEVLLS